MLGASRKKNRDWSPNGSDVSKEAQFRRGEVRTEKGYGAFAYPSQSAPEKVSSIYTKLNPLISKLCLKSV